MTPEHMKTTPEDIDLDRMKDDTISRQAVLKLLSAMPPEEAMTKTLLIQSVKQMDAPDNLVKDSQGLAKDLVNDCISRQAAIDAVFDRMNVEKYGRNAKPEEIQWTLEKLPSAQPDLGKYEYHYDHTDCIWYRPEARNRCPVTCAQYRDGWNDAMNYIFRDGKGYRPYRRGEQYEE